MNPKILIIDDEKTFRDSIRLFLEDYDFEIEEAENGREGTEKILSIKPDLVLIDLYMPEMTGLDVLKWASQHAADLPIIIISGAGVIHDVAEALRCGAWDYLFKPIEDLNILKHAVDQALERAALLKANQNYQQHLESEVLRRTEELRQINRELSNQQASLKRASVEEQVLSELLQFTLRCKDEKEFLRKALSSLVDKLTRWHQIEQGVMLDLSSDHTTQQKPLLLSHACVQAPCLHEDPSFIIWAHEQLKNHAENTIFSTHYQNQPLWLIPVMQGRDAAALLVLSPCCGKPLPAHINTSFIQRVADTLSMGLNKFENERKIRFLAHHDILTGLPNRRLLVERLEQTLKVVAHNPCTGVILYIDLDRFKYLNDSLGHDVGDELLRQAATRLRAAIHEEDLVARPGGDEFVILLTDFQTNLNAVLRNIQKTVENVQQALNLPYRLDEHEYHLSCSIGICTFEDDSESAADLLKHGDTAMYHAKARGGNRFRFYQPDMQRAADTRLSIEKDLRIAIENNQLEVHYQPQVSIHSGTIIGAEALVRWVHPQRGNIPPMNFIPIAEETGMIQELGEWILSSVLHQITQWQQQNLLEGIHSIAVNVCPKQFMQTGFTDTIIQLIQASKVPADMIKLEITEGTLIHNMEKIIDTMRQLKDAGLHFSMDDFGTGYSSLSYLKRLPLDELKIDQSFVRDIADDENDAAIVETIIAMGRHLGLSVIAEGVETEAALERLKQQGCASYQGYLFSRPVPARKMEQLLHHQRENNG